MHPGRPGLDRRFNQRRQWNGKKYAPETKQAAKEQHGYNNVNWVQIDDF